MKDVLAYASATGTTVYAGGNGDGIVVTDGRS